jgi:ADP-ribosylglycohydrolase
LDGATEDLSERIQAKSQGRSVRTSYRGLYGSPIEYWVSDEIFAEYGDRDLTEFLPPRDWDGASSYTKGNGRITDDTLMTEALIRAYERRCGHMDAHDFEEYLLPEVCETEVWVPEFQRTMPILERLWWPERYPHLRLGVGRADPRSAGVGNLVNCGPAMYAMPVGAVNAGDPEGAYAEASALTLAHNESFAVEAAAVATAAYAEAFARGAVVEDVLAVAQGLARDGTRSAIRAAVTAAGPRDDVRTFLSRTRQAVAPYDQRSAVSSTGHPSEWRGSGDVGRPSRVASIEELPVALAVLRYGAGDFQKTLKAAVFYGRDCDTIAAMATGLFGAVHGTCSISRELAEASDEANQRDFGELADRLSQAAETVLEKDAVRFRDRRRAIMGN